MNARYGALVAATKELSGEKRIASEAYREGVLDDLGGTQAGDCRRVPGLARSVRHSWCLRGCADRRVANMSNADNAAV